MNIKKLLLLIIGFTSLSGWASAQSPQPRDFPAGFSEVLFVSGLASPTTMAFAPDGRLFIAEQAGFLRVVKDAQLLPQPFLTVNVDATQERGLLGVAFDPDFASNNSVYIYYTTASDPKRNVVSRFTANGDVAVPGSEQIIFEMDALSSATNHNGGAIHFGPDGKLYIAVGDNNNGANAQSLETVLGKILRINPDGSIPEDNPFYAQTNGKNRAIWAWGLRNPYNFAFDPAAGRMLINDVGQVTWEEINIGMAGANYGWPETEGYTDNPNYVSPAFAYPHTGAEIDRGCSIVGAAFYSPQTLRFPAEYHGDYFFADFCTDWIKHYDPVTGQVSQFGFSSIDRPVDIRISGDGYLYYLSRGSGAAGGAVYRVSFAEADPQLLSPTGTITQSMGNPTYSWQAATGATSYDLYVYRGDNPAAQVLYQTGLTAEQLNCDSTACTLEPVSFFNSDSYWLANNTYGVWWRPNNGAWFGPYTFTMAVPPPALAANMTATPAGNGQVRLSWQGDVNGGWYQVWVGSPAPGYAQAHWRWHPASELGCVADTICELTLDLRSGGYIWYVQAWSPGGFSAGGIQGWAEGAPFTQP